MLLVAGPLSGQSRAGGKVVRIVNGDTLPIAGLPVVLHRVSRTSQGPQDTARADRGGRFSFRFSADTASAYLLSARFGGVEYFSAPLATNPSRPDTSIVVIVADTSSAAPVVLRQRTLLVSVTDESSTRTVLDWLVLSNPGEKTRVVPDTLHPSWGAPLPPDAQNVELADSRLSQFAFEALAFRHDSVLVMAPVGPGDKELMLQYRIPGTLRRFVIPAAGVTDSVFILLEGAGGSVVTPGFASVDSQSIEGRAFQRWAGTIQGSGEIHVTFSVSRITASTILAILAGLTAPAFLILGVGLARRRAGAATLSPRYSPHVLADAAARLDARFAGREAQTPPEEWNRYLEERARLAALLERTLAAGRRRS